MRDASIIEKRLYDSPVIANCEKDGLGLLVRAVAHVCGIFWSLLRPVMSKPNNSMPCCNS